ncbi:hypothetical protein BBAD15_g2554 [Beauveria bassiana D1-5]|uniref:Uncharacterized protein n=1 Tax=Beauveria bassiana D1-5 TaxID=1245745 RepID=A0A0A2VZD8_BEABA|nr:hypothetical protein BBAD15_g2554 [Beauveria bassiana D1-5]
MTPDGYKDTREHTERPRDVETDDEPLKEAEMYLATGHRLLNNYTDADWKSGKLFPIPWEERANITDPRVGTSTGHIPVYTRPPRVCLGWGGYDEFLSWQEAGRAVHKDMVKEEKWNLLRDTTARFVNKEGKVVSVVPNNIPKEHFPHRPEDPVPLFDLLHGRRGGSQRGPETAEGVHNSQVSTAEKDSEHVDHVKSGELN